MTKSRIIKSFLGFLIDDCNMHYSVREMPNVQGVCNPTYLYSFYNEYGCITIREIAQRGELDCFIADHYDEDPQKCIHTMISQTEYIKQGSCIYFTRTYLKHLANFIRASIVETGRIWGIPVDYSSTGDGSKPLKK